MILRAIWQRVRSLFDGSPRPEAVDRQAPPPSTPSFYEYDRPADLHPTEPPVVQPAPPVQEERRRSPAELAEWLSGRLVEDEALRRHLEDEAYQPLLDWGLTQAQRMTAGAGAGAAAAAPAAASSPLEQAAEQLLDLIRTVDVAVGERQSASPELVRGRLELLDTCLQPPLFSQDAAARARARIEALLAEPPEWLQSAPDAELVRRVLEAIE